MQTPETPPELIDKPKKRRRKWVRWVVVLLVLYPLSYGPVTGFLDRTDPWPTMAYDAFYTPLWWVCERVPLCDRALDWYLNICWRIGWKEDAPLNFSGQHWSDPRR